VEDVDLYDALAHDVEEELGVVGALLRSDDVVPHDRAEKLDILLRELEGENGGTGPEAFPKETSVPFLLRSWKLFSNLDKEIITPFPNGLRERKRTCPFQHHQTRLHANTVRDLQHPFHGILLGVQNDVICAMFLRKFRLGLRRRRANHGSAFEFCVLSGDETEPSGDGVDEDRVAFLDFVRFVHEREDGRGLKKPAARSGCRFRIREGWGRFFPRHGDVLRVGACGVLHR
jgi:hypothetical protein